MSTAATDQWGRRRLLRTLSVVAIAAVLLLGGLIYAIYSAVAATTPPVSGVKTGAGDTQQLPAGPDRQNAIAARPMLAVPPEASRPGTPSTRTSAQMLLPPAEAVGPADVPTGFPHTQEGAVAQLAAIETTVLQSMSIDRAHEVHSAWSARGAVRAEDWALTRNIQAFLASGAGRYANNPHTAVVATPAAAQVKGADGTDWVLACVLLEVKAQAATQARLAYGHCERMQWSTTGAGRWIIAAGDPPAKAPSTWPGTEAALDAGWKSTTGVIDE